MAEAAVSRRMTVDEFLSWNDGTEAHYELMDGAPQAMAPTLRGHRFVATNALLAIGAVLRPPCRVEAEAGIRLPHRDDAWYQADLAVSCAPFTPDQRETPDPVLIIEILSPSTANGDRRIKLIDYRTLPSVREIMLIDPRCPYAEVHRRLDGGGWLTDLLRDLDSVLRLDSIGLELPLAELYHGIDLEP